VPFGDTNLSLVRSQVINLAADSELRDCSMVVWGPFCNTRPELFISFTTINFILFRHKISVIIDSLPCLIYFVA
jgi:hypothetical protein